MNILVMGISGYMGSLVASRLQREGHTVRGFVRDPRRVNGEVPVVEGDAVSGVGLERALDGIDVAYFLIHSMEAAADQDPFAVRERTAAARFAKAAQQAGVQRIVYLGGLVPEAGRLSEHLASRLEVERILLEAIPESVALRASIVIGARSRSFGFLVRLVERLPVLALPAWRSRLTQPIDERDMVSLLVAAVDNDMVSGRSLDAAGPDVVSYEGLIDRIADLMLVGRPALRFKRLTATPIASRIAAVIAGEQPELIEPLMESLESDLLPRDGAAAELLAVRLHSLDAAIEHSLREWENAQPLAAR